MLRHLSIRNIILIRDLEFPLAPGLSVFTGETGAGKSIVMDALGFVLGERASSDLLRKNEEQASVVAHFTVEQSNTSIHMFLEEQGIAIEDNILYLRRIISKEGKSRAFVNDVPVTIQSLKLVGSYLIEMHGQHDNHSLWDAKIYRTLLDSYGQLEPLCEAVKNAYHTYKYAEKTWNLFQENQKKEADERAYLLHILDELDQLNPEENEEDLLVEKRQAALTLQKNRDNFKSIFTILTQKNSVLQGLQTAQRILERLHENSPVMEKWIEMLHNAQNDVETIQQELKALLYKDTDSEAELDRMEERLFTLRAMARKCNLPLVQLVEYHTRLKENMQSWQNEELLGAQKKQAWEKTKKDYEEKACSLSEARKRSGLAFSEAIHQELIPLKMERTHCIVDIKDNSEQGWSEYGWDKVSFLVSTNPGSEYGPLTKIASGGEISRFMLALKLCLLHVKDSATTLIFDEIDTGIGGAVADALGKRLVRLSSMKQILVITHQPQVASLGKSHYKVIKKEKNAVMETSVIMLSDHERQEELARMLSGHLITAEARAAARKLLEEAHASL